ncbi:MAG: thermonuclease family protein [Pseudomonadota bacterium]
MPMDITDIGIIVGAIGAALALFFIVRWPGPSGAEVVVEAVLDGESFQLKDRYDGFLNVRIAGVRAPAGDEDGADWATDTLCDLIEGKTCRIRPVDEDPDGFLIARVDVDGEDIGSLLVQRGHARYSDTLFRGKFRRADEG